MSLVDDIGFVIFLLSIVGYFLFAITLNRRHVENRRTKLNRVYDKWVDMRIKAANHIVTVQSERNFITTNSVFISGLLILLGLIVGFLNDGTFETNDYLFALEEIPLFNVKMATNIGLIIYSLLNFMLSVRMHNRFTILITANPENICADEEDDLIGLDLMKNAFRYAQDRFFYGIKGVLFMIASLAWFFDAWFFIGITVGMIVYMIFFEDIGVKIE